MDPYYYLATQGSCVHGQDQFVETESECEAAAEALGLPDVSASMISHSTLPKGCYYKVEAQLLYLNSGGSYSDDDPDRLSLCSGSGTYRSDLPAAAGAIDAGGEHAQRPTEAGVQGRENVL